MKDIEANKPFLLIAILLVIMLPVSAQKTTKRDSLHIAIDEITITGTRAQVNRNNIPMTISVVNRKTIEESTESALLPILSAQVPGMFVTERGVTGFGVAAGGSGGITMRGVGGSPTTEVLILIDGHPQYMGVMGHHLPDAYVASDVERVEVVRGPASILYGSNAMGGVINIITRKQDSKGWSANGRLMYGSYNTQKYQANAGMKGEKLDAFISINHDQTDGHRDNSDFRITNGYARAGYNLSNHLRVWGDASIASYKAQNPGTVSVPMYDNIADILRGVASVTLENNGEKSNGALKLFYNFGRHDINDGYKEGGKPRDYHFRSNDKNLGASLYQIFRLFKGNEMTTGIDFKTFGGHAWNKYDDNRESPNLVDTTLYEIGGYVIMQQTIAGKLTLNGGLRLDYNEVFGHEWVPQVGLAYRPFTNTVIKASIAKGFRSPTIRELYYKASLVAANPNLRPERMINYEISLGQKFFDGRLSTEVTGYIADGSNLIQPQLIDDKSVNMNTGKFKNKGVEVALAWHVLTNLNVQGNYSYLHMDNPIAYAPKQQVFLSGNYQLKKWSLNASYQFVDELYSSTGAKPVKESYGLLNAKVSFRPMKPLNLFISGENLTNRNYEIMSGYPMPGATVMGGVNISLSL